VGTPYVGVRLKPDPRWIEVWFDGGQAG